MFEIELTLKTSVSVVYSSEVSQFLFRYSIPDMNPIAVVVQSNERDIFT